MIDWETETWKVGMVIDRAAQTLPSGDPDRDLLERLSNALARANELRDEQSAVPIAQRVGLVPRP